MGLDFRDFNNDGYPDIVFVALNNQTFPLFQNTGKGDFREVTTRAECATRAMQMSGFGAALYDFDNDGWKDLFVTRGQWNRDDARPPSISSTPSSQPRPQAGNGPP